MEIKNRIIKQAMSSWKDFILLQAEEFKFISPEDEEKLTNSLIENNFIMTFHVCEIDGKIFCIDGHQRIQKIFPKLEKMGYKLPEKFPCCFIECKNESEAAELVYVFNSKYAKIQQSWSDKFIKKFNLDVEKIERTTTLIDIKVDLNYNDELVDPKFEEKNIIINYKIYIEQKDSNNFDKEIRKLQETKFPNMVFQKI